MQTTLLFIRYCKRHMSGFLRLATHGGLLAGKGLVTLFEKSAIIKGDKTRQNDKCIPPTRWICGRRSTAHTLQSRLRSVYILITSSLLLMSHPSDRLGSKSYSWPWPYWEARRVTCVTWARVTLQGALGIQALTYQIPACDLLINRTIMVGHNHLAQTQESKALARNQNSPTVGLP